MLRFLRDEALLMLEGRGAILDVARDVTQILGAAELECPVIGGVAVVLHGYLRTTADVDLFIPDELQVVAEALTGAGYAFHRKRREFLKNGVPVHLVTPAESRMTPKRMVDIDDVHTVSLPDLINLKLTSGLADPLRAIDLADVIGLIRHRRLTASFAAKIAPPLRSEFRKLVRAIDQHRKHGSA